MENYNLVVSGGTFDHLHKGHRSFLKFTASYGRKVLVGLTSDKYFKSKNQLDLIQPYKERKKALEDFLKKEKLTKKIKIIPIDNIFGPTLKKDLLIDAIIITDKTAEGAKTINLKRKAVGLKTLPIIVSPIVKGEDNEVISSSRIRKGEIDREGKLYLNPEWFLQDLILPSKLRSQLKNPFGKILKNVNLDSLNLNPSKTILVGDVVTKTFNNLFFKQKISAVDFLVKRKRFFSNIKELGFKKDVKVVETNNQAGHLTPCLFKSIKNIFDFLNGRNRFVLLVNGEEDLSVLVFLILAPLDFSVLYGQPGEGVVMIRVTEKNKKKAYLIISRFNKIKMIKDSNTRGY